jgi:hypothetical protein
MIKIFLWLNVLLRDCKHHMPKKPLFCAVQQEIMPFSFDQNKGTKPCSFVPRESNAR